jgi:hypothetical protein
MGRFFACQMSLEVTSLPSWAGLPNPTRSDATLLLAVVDGGGPNASSPYTVDRVLLACPQLGNCGRAPLYAFAFAPKERIGTRVEVRMGETKVVDLQPPGALGSIVAHNLRSYDSCATDDYWNFAYYLEWLPPTR